LTEEHELQVFGNRRVRKYLDLRGVKQLSSLENYIIRNSVICAGELVLLTLG